MTLSGSRPIVAFDTLQRTDKGIQSRKGDRELYEGFDSALKAAMFWTQADDEWGSRGRRHMILSIPTLVLSQPYWDVPIDGPGIGDPTVQSAGYVLGIYPVGQRLAAVFPRSSLILVCAFSELPRVVRTFNDLWAWLTSKAVAKGMTS
jgi:hypothetical protein